MSVALGAGTQRRRLLVAPEDIERGDGSSLCLRDQPELIEQGWVGILAEGTLDDFLGMGRIAHRQSGQDLLAGLLLCEGSPRPWASR